MDISDDNTPLPSVREILNSSLHNNLIRSSEENEEMQQNHLLPDGQFQQNDSHRSFLNENEDKEIGERNIGYSSLMHNDDKDKQQDGEDFLEESQHTRNEHEDNSQPSKSPLENKVSELESLLKIRCDEMSREMKLVLAELNIITEWIHSRFGNKERLFTCKGLKEFNEDASVLIKDSFFQ
jgi:hypothetical protein